MKYKVVKELTLGVGNEVILTPRQAQARNLCLSCVDEDKYMVLRNCVFKRGEVICFNEVPEKRMIKECLEPVEPASDEPASDEPASDEPASVEPASDEPASDEPASDEPASDEPASDEPASDEPASDEPASDEPASVEPASDEPASVESESVVKRRYRRKNV